MANEKSILVTGSPRAGTTWIGRLLAQATGMHYIHKPFNISGRPCACGTNFKYWFQYISPENETIWYDHLNHILDPSINWFNFRNALIQSLTTKRISPTREFARNIRASRMLIKDPIAVFSSEWLASQFDLKVVVLLRHPAAIASSYKRLNWTHPFEHFLEQPLLMCDHLYPFTDEIKKFTRDLYPIVDQAALLWKLIHSMILYYKEVNPNWIYIRHEDFSSDPQNGFQLLFDQLNLEMPENIVTTIHNSSKSENPTESDDPYNIKLHSLETTSKWKSCLKPIEIERIYQRVGEIGRVFYPEQYWVV